ncbi:MAG TPA: hypothetical protein PKN48_00460 [Bacteroidales bacterium]|nr:hypothetical protein [Bacteroidales bacterium]
MITVDTKSNFQVYLEGVSVPFSSITITESEAAFPTASVVFPAVDGALRLLPGTIVQIFGPIKTKYGEDYTGLLFEGEISGIQYSKSAYGRQANILCNSLFARFYQSTIIPVDGLITEKLRNMLIGKAGTHTETDPSSPYLNAVKTVPNKFEIGGVFANKSKVHTGVTNSLAKQIKDLQIKQSARKGHTGDIDAMVLMSAANLPVQFMAVMSHGVVRSGDFLPMVQFFLRYYEKSDPYFGVQSLSYGLTKSIFVFPNKGKVTPFLHKLVLDNMTFRLSMSTNTRLTLWDVLSTFMSITYYSLICPAAPTETKPFWSSQADSNIIIPNRLFFLPSLENAPPAKFNIIFPSQINAFSYQRDMTSEATRVVGEMGIPYFNTSLKHFKGINVCAVVPQLETIVDGKYKLMSNLTVEESYRGIRPAYETMEYLLSSATNTIKTDKIKEGSDEKLGEVNSGQDIINLNGTFGDTPDDGLSATTTGFGSSFLHLIAESYLSHKYSKRILSVNCEWSPYRMTGVPGAIIDDSGPSIVGVVASIVTNISSDGKATSTLSIRAPRLVFDDEFYGAFQGRTTDVRNTENIDNYLINDFTNDGFLDINKFLFDEDMYSFDNIGFNLYTYFATGRESAVTKQFSGYSGSIYKRFKSVLQSYPKNTGDFSILGYLRPTTLSTTYNTDLNDFFDTTDTAEIRNSKLIFLAIQKLKTLYANAKNAGSFTLSEFVTNETWRSVISKENYFNSIGITALPSWKDCKDGTLIFGSATKVRGMKAYFDDKRNLDTFVTKITEDMSISDVHPEASVAVISGADRMDSYYADTETVNGKDSVIKKEISEKAARIAALKTKIYRLDNWLSAGTKKSWIINGFYSGLTEDEIFTLDCSESDFLNLLEELYGTNTDAAEKKLKSLRYELSQEEGGIITLEKATSDISKLSYGSGKESLESDTFKPYNKTRYAHVKKVFEKYNTIGNLTVIENK